MIDGVELARRELTSSWKGFLAGLREQGLRGMQLLISDSHGATRAAVSRVLGATWQRCGEHFMRQVLVRAGRSGRRVVSVFIGTAFTQNDPKSARDQWSSVRSVTHERTQVHCADGSGRGRRTRLHGLPRRARAKLHSTNPLERLNGEIKRRTDIVGVFPNEAAITRLVVAIVLEQSDEWSAHRARYMTVETMTELTDTPDITLPAVAT